MPAPPARDRWSRLILDFEASGLLLDDFARQRGVRASTLVWWRSQLRRAARRSGPTFTEVSVVDAAVEVEDHLVLTLAGGAASLRVHARTDLRLLRAVLEALC